MVEASPANERVVLCDEECAAWSKFRYVIDKRVKDRRLCHLPADVVDRIAHLIIVGSGRRRQIKLLRLSERLGTKLSAVVTCKPEVFDNRFRESSIELH